MDSTLPLRPPDLQADKNPLKRKSNTVELLDESPAPKKTQAQPIAPVAGPSPPYPTQDSHPGKHSVGAKQSPAPPQTLDNANAPAKSVSGATTPEVGARRDEPNEKKTTDRETASQASAQQDLFTTDLEKLVHADYQQPYLIDLRQNMEQEAGFENSKTSSYLIARAQSQAFCDKRGGVKIYYDALDSARKADREWARNVRKDVHRYQYEKSKVTQARGSIFFPDKYRGHSEIGGREAWEEERQRRDLGAVTQLKNIVLLLFYALADPAWKELIAAEHRIKATLARGGGDQVPKDGDSGDSDGKPNSPDEVYIDWKLAQILEKYFSPGDERAFLRA